MLMLRRMFLCGLVLAVMGAVGAIDAEAKSKPKPQWATVTVLNGLDASDSFYDPPDSLIDVAVDGEEEITDLDYGRSQTLKLLAGSYELEVFDSDGNSETIDITVEACQDYTLLWYQDDTSPQLELFLNDLSPAAKLRSKVTARNRGQDSGSFIDVDFYGTYANSSRTLLLADVLGGFEAPEVINSSAYPGRVTFAVYDAGTAPNSTPYANVVETVSLAPRFGYFLYLVGDFNNGTLDILVERRLLKLK